MTDGLISVMKKDSDISTMELMTIPEEENHGGVTNNN